MVRTTMNPNLIDKMAYKTNIIKNNEVLLNLFTITPGVSAEQAKLIVKKYGNDVSIVSELKEININENLISKDNSIENPPCELPKDFVNNLFEILNKHYKCINSYTESYTKTYYYFTNEKYKIILTFFWWKKMNSKFQTFAEIKKYVPGKCVSQTNVYDTFDKNTLEAFITD